MPKKITIFLIFVLAGAATFLAGYLFSQKSADQNPDQQALINNSLISRFEKTPEKYGLPAGVFSLTKEGADFIALTTDGKGLVFYIPKTGEIRTTEIQNVSAGSTLLAKIQPDAQKISWASNKTLVAVYKTGAVYYDLDSGSSKKLDPKIKNPAFSKSGDKIAYDYFDENAGAGEIRVADPKFETFKKIMPTGFANWQISWLNDRELSLVKPPNPENPTYWVFTLNTENGWFNNALEAKNGLEILWSPNGQKLLYSDSDSYSQTVSLHLLDVSTNQEIDLDAKTTASRCTWSIDGKTIYCATSDSFASMDTSAASGTFADIFDSSQSNISLAAGNTSNLFLSSLEDYFIFKNSQDQKLYGLRLSQE